jgi:uncharacterized protein (UPF0332 family)
LAVALVLDDKARENLEAAERLLQNEEGRDCLPNAVASRAYYAAYLAVAHVAQTGGLPFTSPKSYYRHDSLPDVAARHRVLDHSGAVALRWLYSLRLKADYTDEPVEFDDANLAYEKAKLLVENLTP